MTYYYPPHPPPPRTVRQNLRQAKSFSAFGLLLTLCGSIIGTAVPAFTGQAPLATLGGTVALSLFTSLGLTGADGTARGVRAVATLLLTAAAVAVTVSGVTLTDLVRGKSLSGDTQKTFPVALNAAEPPPQPDPVKIQISTAITCNFVKVGVTRDCPPIVVRSVGSAPLKVTSLEFKGTNANEFALKENVCDGLALDPGESCTITVRFTPGAKGTRSAQLVVHQNLRGPASTVKLTGGSSTTISSTTTTTRAPTPTTTGNAGSGP